MNKLILALFFSVGLSYFATAQDQATVRLMDGTSVAGIIKANAWANGMVVINTNDKKLNYTVMDITGFETAGVQYIIVQNDIFKIVGENSAYKLLKKESDNNGKIISVGNESLVLNTSDGKKGSYYLFAEKEGLIGLNKKNITTVISETTLCPTAKEAAKVETISDTIMEALGKAFSSCK